MVAWHNGCRMEKSKKETINIPLNFHFLGVIFLIILIIILFRQVQILNLGKKTTLPLPIPTITITQPTDTPTPTVRPTVQIIAPTTDPDPIIKCSISANCGGGAIDLRSSVCSQSTCCQVGDKWYFYQSKSKCTADQNTYNTNVNNTYVNSGVQYYPCTLYYPALKLYQTYNSLYATKGQCDAEQASLNSGSSNTPPTYTQPVYVALPTPTPDPYCATAVSNWKSFEENFMAGPINNYSSSYEGMLALQNYMHQYQQVANNHNCGVTLYM